MNFRLVLLTLALSSAALVAKPIASSLPVGLTGPSPVGLIFPGFGIAGAINAASLPSERATGLTLAVSPATPSSAAHGFASVATTDKKMGISAGYLGTSMATSSTSTALTHSAFAALGFKIEPVQIGVTVRNLALQTSGYPTDVDFSLLYANENISFGGVAYAVNTNFQPGFGLGYKRGKVSHLEANILLPVGSSSTTLLVAGGMAASIFDVFFNVRYLLSSVGSASNSFGYIFGVAVWPGEHLNFLVQYESASTFASGTITAGLSLFL